MKDNKLKIVDGSGDKKYFSQLPHYILNHSTAIDQSLYWQMKRYSGENGTCFATQETVMKKMGIGRKAYNKSLKYLLDKGWIKFMGMSAGKTRPINTYSITDIWKLNILNYEKIENLTLKIPTKRAVSSKKIQAERTRDTGQKNSKIQAERHSIRRTLKEEHIKKKQRVRAVENIFAEPIHKIFDIFYQNLNPTISWGNKTSRKAAQELIDKLGEEKAIRSAEYAVSVQGKKYAPTITTPYQLKEKLAELVIYYKKENGSSAMKGIKIR